MTANEFLYKAIGYNRRRQTIGKVIGLIPANLGSETPIQKSGHWYLYVWNYLTDEHYYIDTCGDVADLNKEE